MQNIKLLFVHQSCCTLELAVIVRSECRPSGRLVGWLPGCSPSVLYYLSSGWQAAAAVDGGAQQLKRKNRASNSFGGSCCSGPLYSGTIPYYVQINIREMIIQWYLAGNFPKCSSGNVCVVQCRGQKDGRMDEWSFEEDIH